MGHHPETLIYSFPPHVVSIKGKDGQMKPRRFANWLHDFLRPWAGFNVWHVDPCKNVPYQRDDDSCGWFDRGPGDYASAVRSTLEDEGVRKMVDITVQGRLPAHLGYHENLPIHVGAAIYKTIAMDLEYGRRSHMRTHGHYSSQRAYERRMRETLYVAETLALSSVDNLLHIHEYPRLVTLIAAALNRHFRPWWKHPRWHVHHWKITWALPYNLRRAFIDRCAHCRKVIGWGKSPLVMGHGKDQKQYHTSCPH